MAVHQDAGVRWELVCDGSRRAGNAMNLTLNRPRIQPNLGGAWNYNRTLDDVLATEARGCLSTQVTELVRKR